MRWRLLDQVGDLRCGRVVLRLSFGVLAVVDRLSRAKISRLGHRLAGHSVQGMGMGDGGKDDV